MDARLIQPIKRGQLRVLAEPDCKPYCHKRKDGRWEGIEVDIVEAFALHIGCTASFVSCKPGHAYTSKMCIRDNFVSSYRLASADVDLSIGGYSDAWPEPGLRSSCPAFPWCVEDLYLDRRHDDIPTIYMYINSPNSRQLEDFAMMNWPNTPGGQDRYVQGKANVPKGEAATEFNTYTTFTLPKKGKFYKLAAYPNQIYCRTASMLSGILSAHIVRMRQTHAIQKILTKYKVNDTKVPPSINPRYITLSSPGVLRVSAPTFLPVMDATRKVGIDVEIFRAFAKVLKVKLELKTITTGSLAEEDANYATGDVWAGGLSFAVERENTYTQWTAPYLTTKRSCIFRAEDDFKNVKDVTGSIYVRGSSSADEDARAQGLLAKTVNDSQITEVNVYQDVLDGKMTGALRGSIVAKALVKAYPGKFAYLEWERDAKHPENLHYMVSTHSNLNVALSSFVQRLICTGQMSDIVERSYITMKLLKLRVNGSKSSRSSNP